MKPTWKKLITPVALIALSQVPNMLIQQGIFCFLSIPLSFIYHGPPFVYVDKPGFITPLGSLVTAIVYAAIIYVVTCAVLHVTRRSAA